MDDQTLNILMESDQYGSYTPDGAVAHQEQVIFPMGSFYNSRSKDFLNNQTPATTIPF